MARINFTKKQGATGTTVNAGVIVGEEYNPKLRDQNALRIYDEMVRSDATVSATLDAIKLPLKGADHDIDPASEDARDIEIADFVRECLFSIVNWDQFFDEALTYLEFGFSVHEMLFEAREVLGKPRIALVGLDYRKQTTITKWTMKDLKTPGVTQLVADGHEYEIPAEKLVRLTFRQRGENYTGISILRSAYKHYYIKDNLYRYDAIAHQKQAVGVLDITVPTGATQTDKEAIRRAARQLRANQESYIEHPEGFVVQFLDMKANSLRDVEPSINHHDRQISKNVLAQFLEIGAAGSSGTRSVGEDQSRLFEKSLQNVAKQFMYAIQRTIVKTLVDLNFTDVKEYPTYRMSNISDENIPIVSDAVSKFVTAGVLHPRADDENATRKMIGWPKLSDEELEEIDYSKGKPLDMPEKETQTDTTTAKTAKVNPEKVETEDIKASAAYRDAIAAKNALNERLYGTAGHDIAA